MFLKAYMETVGREPLLRPCNTVVQFHIIQYFYLTKSHIALTCHNPYLCTVSSNYFSLVCQVNGCWTSTLFMHQMRDYAVLYVRIPNKNLFLTLVYTPYAVTVRHTDIQVSKTMSNIKNRWNNIDILRKGFLGSLSLQIRAQKAEIREQTKGSTKQADSKQQTVECITPRTANSRQQNSRQQTTESIQ